jgi:hypothetical protein
MIRKRVSFAAIPLFAAIWFGRSNVARREQSTAGVQSGPKSVPYRMQNMETLHHWATLCVAVPTARRGEQAQH